MATRLFDLFAAQFGDSPNGANAVQRVGPGMLRITHGFPPIAANDDGLAGESALDKGPFFCQGGLGCGDISTFAAVLAAFEGATGGKRAIMAEAKEVGAATVTDILIKRALLTGARLSLRANAYGEASYDFRCSCDSASDSQDDEISFVEAQAKTTTIGSGKRTYRVVSAIHSVGGQAYACTGLDVNVTGQVAITAGDGDYGETVEVSGYQVGGTITFQDYDVATLLSKAQSLIAASPGSLVAVLRQQGGSVSTTLTLANAQFFDVDDSFTARQYGVATLRFRCAFASGTTPYLLATGANKVIAMA